MFHQILAHHIAQDSVKNSQLVGLSTLFAWWGWHMFAWGFDKGGATPGDVAKAILGNFTGSIAKAVGSLGVGQLGQTAADGVRKGAKTLEGGAKETTDQAKLFGRKLGDMLQGKK